MHFRVLTTTWTVPVAIAVIACTSGANKIRNAHGDKARLAEGRQTVFGTAVTDGAFITVIGIN